MPALLALDPGTCTGWAVGRADGSVGFGTWTLRGLRGARSLDLRYQLDAMLAREQFERVGYEAVWQGPHVNAVASLRWLEGEIQSWAENRRLPYAAYTPREIKASVAGGRATKERMVQVVRWLGYPVADDHQADAVALLLLMRTGTAPAAPTRKAAVRTQRKRVADLFSQARGRRRPGFPPAIKGSPA
jgi:Holliday junction resolvasome RuvABC endonuclease subunit